MARLDVLRMSLLASLAACGPPRVGTAMSSSTDSDSDSDSDPDSGPDSDSGTTTAQPETETGEGGIDACAAGCEGAVILADGFVECPDGTINRMYVAPTDPSSDTPSCHGDEVELYCMSDADCVEYPHGKCIHRPGFDGIDLGGPSACVCEYSCASDDDCAMGEFCMPAEVHGGHATCQPASCTQNSDCGECGECAVGAWHDGCSWNYSLACRHATDECRTGADCEEGDRCFPVEPDQWICVGTGCVLGRPLRIDRVARTAPLQRRSDWTEPANVAIDKRLAARWASNAALEHASVASFARFGLQLLALGAPPGLLRATSQAAVDEVEHARLAYGLASAYGGVPVGPGRLDLRGPDMSTNWRDVVRDLIEEACVGETLSVAQALEDAQHAETPKVRAVLERIAADELRHAQLAWRALAWMLREADDVNRAWAIAVLERAIERAHDAGDDLQRRAARQVLAPVARSLG